MGEACLFVKRQPPPRGALLSTTLMGQHTVFVKTSRERCTDRGSVNDGTAMGQHTVFVKTS